MKTENTRDLSQFGFIELKEAGKLLIAYTNQSPDFLGKGVAVEFNPDSGNVFLVDEDYTVAMMNGDKLEQWFNCPCCGTEGFKEDIKHQCEEDGIEWQKEIGVLTEAEEVAYRL